MTITAKQKIISSAPGDAHETTYLNRKIRWDVYNWMSYEGGEKHTDLLLKEWGLVQCKMVSSTLKKDLEDKVGEGGSLLFFDIFLVPGHHCGHFLFVVCLPAVYLLLP